MTRWRVVGVLAWRVVRQRLFSWPFAMTVLGMPLVWLAVAVGSTLWVHGLGGERVRVALVDETGVLAEPVLADARRADDAATGEGWAAWWVGGVDLVAAPTPDAEVLDAEVLAGRLDGWVRLDADTLTTGRAVWRGTEAPPVMAEVALRGAVLEAVVRQRLGDRHDRVTGLLAGLQLEVVDERGADRTAAVDVEEVTRQVGGAVGLFAMFVVMSYVALVLDAVQEERAEGLGELLVTVVRPWQLVAGRLLGVGALAAVHLAVWGIPAAGVLAVGRVAVAMMAGGAPGDALAELPMGLLHAGLLGALVLLCFAVSSGLGVVLSLAAVRETEREMIATGLMLGVMGGTASLLTVDDPHHPLLLAASLIPPLTPQVIWLRWLGDAPLWQLALHAAWLLGWTWVVVRLASAAYRVGVTNRGEGLVGRLRAWGAVLRG